MAGPRFLFICLYAGRIVALPLHLNARTKYDKVAWRLLGANNRELGRSPVWYADVESCRDAVRVLKREIASVTPAMTTAGLPGGAWSWRLAVSGKPVAMAGRPYHRQRECAYNLSHFVAAVPYASIADEPSVPVRR